MNTLVLFDGLCQFCNGSVNFIIDHDPNKHCYFAALQSEVGQYHLQRLGLSPTDFDTMIVVEDERYYLRSTAALRIAKHLNGLWPILYYLLIWIPAPIRDMGYRIIAKNRYKWFGQLDACRIPTPELRSRFVSELSS